VWELTEHVSWLKIATLVLNVLAVLYIALAKRLFGLRGGRRAFDEERRGASLLEVEESAGVTV
jgi:predicted membrane-bound mannosyltransferase